MDGPFMPELPQTSNREREVIQLLLEGKSNKLIAAEMHVTERTVEFHLTNIYSKFQVNSRTELILRLKEDPGWPEAEKLGDSTVANEGDLPDNDGRPGSSSWVTSLQEAVAGIGQELKMGVSSLNSDSNTNPTTFFGSIRTCLTKYADFDGRASRAETWWFVLFVLLGASAFSLLNEAYGSIFLLAFLLPLLAVGTRRLRDCGQNPWWLLALLLPIGGLVIVGWMWALPPVGAAPEQDTLSS